MARTQATSGGAPAHPSTAAPRASAQSPTPRWLRWAPPWLRARLPLIGVCGLIVAYLGLWGYSASTAGNATDLDVFFLPSARIALSGHPFAIYHFRYQEVYPNANGPLSNLPLTVVAAFIQALGGLNNVVLRRIIVTVVFAIFPLLLAREAVHTADRLLMAPLRGLRRLLAYGFFALMPEFWHSMLFYGHIEQPIMLWLTLCAVSSLARERPGLAGAQMGLALLARSSAVLYLLALAVLLVGRQRWRASATLLAVAGAVVTLGLLPYWIVDRQGLTYALLTFRGSLPVSGGSVWGLTIGTPLEAVANRFDSLAAVALTFLLCALTVGRRRDLTAASPHVFAVLALASLCFPLLMKTLWPYYFLDASIFTALWWFLGARRLWDARGVAYDAALRGWRGVLLWSAGVALPLAVIDCALAAEQGLSELDGGVWTRRWSLTMTLAMLALLVGICLWLWWLEGWWLRLRARSLASAAYTTDGGMPQPTA